MPHHKSSHATATKSGPKVIVAGADWCHDTVDTLAKLDELSVKYSYIDIEQDPVGEQWVKDQNDGKLKRPTVDVDGIILSVPDEDELIAALEAKGLL